MVKRYLLVASIIIQLVLIDYSVSAKDVPVTLTALEVTYNDHSRQIEAVGEVKVIYKDVRIKADTVLLDRDLKMIYAKGNINVVKGNDGFQGEQFIYDLCAECGWIVPLATEVKDAEMKAPAFFTAAQGNIRGEDVFLKNASFTSCSLPEPHYHLTAEKVEYFPDERIIFHKMWYWEGKHRLFYFPYFYISLKPEQDSGFDVKAGWADDTGRYLYIGYNYYLNSHNSGKIYTNITEYGGDGLGIKNTTKSSDQVKWYQDFYYQDNSDHDTAYDEYKLGWGYENTQNSKFKISTAAENWYYTNVADSTYSKITIALKGSTPYPSVTMKYIDNEGTAETLNVGQSWSYRTKSKFSISTNGTWYHYDYDSGSFTNSFRYHLNASKDWDWSNIALKLSNSRVYSSSSTSSYNYLPEITYNIPKLRLPLLGEIVYKGQYTNYQYLSTYNDKITSDLTGERLANSLSKTINLWEKSSLKLYTDTKYHYRYYIVNGIASYFAGFIESLNLKKTFRKELSTTVGADYTVVKGTPPSIFVSAYSDSLTDGGSLTNSWAWDGKAFDTSLSTGYNLKYNTFNPVYIILVWNPDAKKSLSLSTVAYLQDDSYYHTGLGSTTFSSKVNLNDNFRINTGFTMDLQDNSWGERYFETDITQQLIRNWQGKLLARYSDVLGDFSTLEAVLTYDWHCRELVFSYDYSEEKFWIQINFKAFPQVSISTDTDPSEYLYQ